ncbi:hypothetical protein [Caloranaerobacter ferrireducens]|uniref:hypothetical protein n=1 Tax=Caloranaerobacter ferrireducens TaxID=1323370 RepID=UPI00084D93A6|nr:hypothetical protein [Caloranaerobacter ferrireducens]
MNRKPNKIKNFYDIPTFTWGGTTLNWQKEAEELKDYINEKNDDIKTKNSKKRYYLRDQN